MADTMTEKERQIIPQIVTNLNDIPEDKLEYLNGYAQALVDTQPKDDEQR